VTPGGNEYANFYDHRIPDLGKINMSDANNRIATTVMMLNIVATVLSNPDINEMTFQLSQKIRELTGSRIVILSTSFAHDDGWLKNRILAVAPSRHAALAETAPVMDIMEKALQLDHATFFPIQTGNGKETNQTTGINIFPCLVMPLKIGEERIGSILSLGLLGAGFIDSILEIENILSGIVSVVLKNVLMKERQQQILQKLEREIEDRKIAEAKLRESEQRIRSLVETTSDWIWETDATGTYTYSNPKVEDLLGYTTVEVLGKKTYDFMPPEEAEKTKALMREIINNPMPISAYQNINLSKDGRKVILETNGEPFFDNNNIFAGYRGIDRDITRRKQAEESLALERQRLANIIEGTNAGTWEWNIRTGEIVLNDRWAEMLGYTLAELAPVSIDTIENLTHPDDMETSKDLLARHFKKELPYYECELRMRHKNGGWVWIHASGKVAAWTEDGKALMIFGTHQDITRRKLAEEKIQHMATHDALTGLPAIKLAEDRLAMAIGMARRQKKLTAVMFIDLDGFKTVNDTLGHNAGDYLLKEAAKRMLACVRETDTVARYGGDEFLLIAAALRSMTDAEELAQKVINVLSQPVIYNDQQALIGASIGISLYPPNGKDMDKLIRLADEAMYQSKNSGKNRFTFAKAQLKSNHV
jgi:diguanylate cyclase (GGDEF)-like protein/PAS domain S-box-containing protein